LNELKSIFGQSVPGERSLAMSERVDQACRQFEDEWNAGHRPKLEDCLAGLDGAERDRLLTELVAIEIELRTLAGERPTATEYESRFPDAQSALSMMFRSALSMESLNPSTANSGLQGEEFGDFQIIRELGRGGMGVVYEALQKSLGRRVALKALPQRLDIHQDRRRRFLREARAIGRLHHNNIVDVFGTGEHAGISFIVMRLIDGVGMDALISSEGRKRRNSRESVMSAEKLTQLGKPNDLTAICLSEEVRTSPSVHSIEHSTVTPRLTAVVRAAIANTQSDSNRTNTVEKRVLLAAKIGSQIADALQYAHQCGVFHRDVKPSNILVESNDAAWLADFGLAKVLQDVDSSTLTEDGSVPGTLKYLPPESLKGKIDARGDIYSLGLSLYELVALKPAFVVTDRIVFLEQLSQARVERLEQRVPKVPRDLATVIHKAIDPEPNARYQTAGELADDLRRFLNDEPILARRVSSFEHLVRWSRRNKTLAATLASLAFLVTLIAVSSMIAASYFHSLSSDLTNTVADLTIVTQTARRLADEAESARQASQVTLADMQTERGLLASEQGDFATAMLWFAKAAEQTPEDHHRSESNRLRAMNWMNESVLPVASFKFPVAAVRKRLTFQPRPKGDRGVAFLLSVAKGHVQILNLQTEQSLPWTASVTPFTDACWMPDGSRIVVSLSSGEVQIRDVDSGQIVHSIPAAGPVETICCSADGARIATGGNVVQLWNVRSTPILEQQWPHPQAVHSMSFNAASNRLVTACRDDQARVFAVSDSGSSKEPLFEPVQHKTYVECSPVFRGNDTLVTAFNWQIDWRDATTGETVGNHSASALPVTFRLSVSPDGQTVAASTEATIEVFPPDGDRLTITQSHPVSDTTFSPDGSMLVSACADWNALIWSPPWGKQSPLKVPLLRRPELCSFSSNGRLIATCSDTEIRVWKLPQKNTSKIAAPGWGQVPTKPRLSFDGRLVTRGKWHEMPWVPDIHQLSVLDATTGLPVGPELRLFGIIDSSMCADDKSVAVISRHGSTGMLSLFDVFTGKRTLPAIELTAKPHSVAARPGKNQVAVFCEDGTLIVFDAHNGRRLLEQRHDNWKWTDRYETDHSRVVWSPDGTALITVTSNSDIVVRDGDSGEERFPPIKPLRDGGVCRSLDISQNSTLLATAVTGENAVQVWNLKSGQAVSPPLLHPGDAWGMFAVKFSPDGLRLLTGNKDGLARLWNWKSATLTCPAMKHTDEVYDVAFTSDGNHALTIDRAALVHAWNLVTGKRIAAPLDFPKRTDGFSNAVCQLAIVSDRAIVGAPDFPVLDLKHLLTPPAQTSDSLRLLAELGSARRIAMGDSNVLTSEEWEARWSKLSDRPAVEDVSTGKGLLREVNEDDARRSAERLLEKLPANTLEERSLKEHHIELLRARELSPFLILASLLSLTGNDGRALEMIQEAWPTETTPEFGFRLYITARCYRQFHQTEAAQKDIKSLLKWLAENPLPSSLKWLTPELVRQEDISQ
jgi:serine/threonine protein kinase/WD40 repeat protein